MTAKAFIQYQFLIPALNAQTGQAYYRTVRQSDTNFPTNRQLNVASIPSNVGHHRACFYHLSHVIHGY